MCWRSSTISCIWAVCDFCYPGVFCCMGDHSLSFYWWPPGIFLLWIKLLALYFKQFLLWSCVLICLGEIPKPGLAGSYRRLVLRFKWRAQDCSPPTPEALSPPIHCPMADATAPFMVNSLGILLPHSLLSSDLAHDYSGPPAMPQ
jgi:hypothetical protein